MVYVKKSPWVIHYDASSCNGCDIEVLACLTPLYDVERFGIVNTGNPKHADIFLVTGSVNEQNRDVIRNIYAQMPEPKVVVAIGICATSGGIFRECYNVLGGVDQVIPVDVYVPGCAARPELIIDGVVTALGVLDQKQLSMTSSQVNFNDIFVGKAETSDAAALMTQEKIACTLLAEKAENTNALKKNLNEFALELSSGIFFKAVTNGKIIGGLFGKEEGDEIFISNLFINPFYRNKGIATKLLAGFEQNFPSGKRFRIRVTESNNPARLFLEKNKFFCSKTTPQPDSNGVLSLEKVKK